MRVEVSGRLLRWACERAGLEPDAATARFSDFPDWESGELKPTLKQLEKFASALHVPIGFLFLTEPPIESLPIPDFRTVGGTRVERPSPELLETVYLCKQRQEWYRDYARSVGEEPKAWIGAATLKSDVVETAATIRSVLAIDNEERKRWSTWTEALRRLIELADIAGVLVMVNGIVGSNTHRKLDPDEFRGFALADDLAPLVFVNGADTKAAQMFTLAHEIAHLWLGKSGLSDVGPTSQSSNEVEQWCNQVAAELLVPLQALRAEYRSGATMGEEKDRLARYFKVSTLVMLRRLHDLGAMPRARLSKMYDEELKKLVEIVRRSSGGEFYNTQIVRVGKRFQRALITSTLEGQTLHRDAFRLLGFSKLSAFQELGRRLGVTT